MESDTNCIWCVGIVDDHVPCLMLIRLSEQLLLTAVCQYCPQAVEKAVSARRHDVRAPLPTTPPSAMLVISLLAAAAAIAPAFANTPLPSLNVPACPKKATAQYDKTVPFLAPFPLTTVDLCYANTTLNLTFTAHGETNFFYNSSFTTNGDIWEYEVMEVRPSPAASLLPPGLTKDGVRPLSTAGPTTLPPTSSLKSRPTT
jgi:hypothetical protein